jgi:hypothetical protein
MSKHARTTISIPPDLKARMDAVDESVNWSALACQAFERKLAEIIKRKGSGNLSDVISRLRVSKRKFENEQYQEGHAAGQVWAKEEAEAEELIRLRDWKNQCGNDWDDSFRDDDQSAYGACERLVFHIWPEDDGDRGAVSDFWVQRGYEDYRRGDFVRGFADGALVIWNEVRDKI